MKVDFYTDTYKPEINGVVTAVEALRNGLVQSGNQVAVFAPLVPGYEDPLKGIFRISSVKVSRQFEQRMILPLPTKHFRNVFASKPDIVHVHSFGPLSILGALVAKSKKVPLVYTYHTFLPKYTHYFLSSKIMRPWMAKRYSRFLCNLSDWVVVPSEKIREELVSWGVEKPISVIANGVDLTRLNVDTSVVRERYVPGSNKVLLYVGRVTKEKNLEFLLRTFKGIKKQSQQASLVIVGEGNYLDKLKKKYAGRGVVFTGAIEHEKVAGIYVIADVFVMSSRSETYCYSLVEALGFSLPVVALADNVFGDKIINGYNGYMVKNEKEFAQRVCELLEDREKAAALGKNSLKIARENFDVKSSVGKHIALYKNVIRHHNKSKKDFTREEEIAGKGLKGLATGGDGGFSFRAPVFVSLVVVAALTFLFVNKPSDIKAYGGQIVSKVKSSEVATRSADVVRDLADRVEEKLGRTN